MFYYIIPILLSFAIAVNKTKCVQLYSWRCIIIYIFIVSFIYCSGYMTGSDWKSYELLYNDASWNNLKSYEHEKGFYFVLLLFKSIGFSFFAFSILFKIIVFYVISYYLFKNSSNFYMCFALLLSTRALFLFVDCPFRFMCACGIVVCSYKYLINRNLFSFSLLILIAMQFHISSVIMFLVYFLLKVRIDKINRTVLALVYLILYLIITPQMITTIIAMYFPTLIELIETYYIKALGSDIAKLSIGNIFDIILFITVLLYKETVITKISKEFYSLTIISLFISLISLTIPTMFRLIIYVLPFLYISVSVIMDNIKRTGILLKYIFILYFIASPISQIYSTYVYIPYSNYFLYLFKDDIKYSDRCRYNREKYFERVGEYPID